MELPPPTSQTSLAMGDIIPEMAYDYISQLSPGILSGT
jgi:hypothetical protein